VSVVSDTTPLNYLILINAVEVLPRLFGRVYAPKAVLEELRDPKSPERVRQWAVSPPEWLTVRDPTHLDRSLPTKLGDGEVAAISLASEMSAAVLLDDKDARKAAGERKLPMARTLSVLVEAACRDFIDIDAAVSRLRGTTYRAKEEHYQAGIEQVQQRKATQERDR
jgi:predicted nucleic acid-binding protein